MIDITSHHDLSHISPPESRYGCTQSSTELTLNTGGVMSLHTAAAAAASHLAYTPGAYCRAHPIPQLTTPAQTRALEHDTGDTATYQLVGVPLGCGGDQGPSCTVLVSVAP